MKIMLKLLSAILTLCLLVACSSAGTASGPGGKETPKNYPEVLNIYCQYAFFNDSYQTDVEGMNEWVNSINESYPFDVSVDASRAFDIFGRFSSGQLSGIAAMPTAQVISLIQSGSILPLDEYLKDNPVWMSLPEEYRKIYEYKGHIWALPKHSYNEPEALSIRTDWLKKVGMSTPASAAELLEVARAFMEKDANGNGVKDDYIYGGYPTLLQGVILQNFGCNLGTDNIALAYDPAQDSIVDCMFTPAAREAMKYLVTLVKERLIDPRSFGGFESSNEAYQDMTGGAYGLYIGSITGGKYGTGINWTVSNAQEVLGHPFDKNNAADYDYATNLYQPLPPLSENAVVTDQYQSWGYVISSTTDQPGETLNAFLDLTLSSKDNYLKAAYGLPEHYILSGGNVLTLKYSDEATKTVYSMPGLLSLDEYMLGTTFYVDRSNESARISLMATHSAEIRNYKKDFLERYKKQYIQVPTFYKASGACFSDHFGVYQTAMYTMAESLDDEGITADQLINTYQQKVTSEGNVQIALKESNEFLGLRYQ